MQSTTPRVDVLDALEEAQHISAILQWIETARESLENVDAPSGWDQYLSESLCTLHRRIAVVCREAAERFPNVPGGGRTVMTPAVARQ